MEQTSTTIRLLALFARDVLLATGRRTCPPCHGRRLLAPSSWGFVEASSYSRFFGVRSAVPSRGGLRRTTEQDVNDHVAQLVDARGELIGVGEYYAGRWGRRRRSPSPLPTPTTRASRHCCSRISPASLANRFRRLVAETLPDNVGMQQVFRDVGLVNRLWFEDGAVQVSR